MALERELIELVIYEGVRGKAEVVAADEREAVRRRGLQPLTPTQPLAEASNP